MSREPKCGDVRFIAIDGRAGSGKTTAAQTLAQILQAEIIHTDDFANWENPVNWWPIVIKQIFEPIEKGAKTLSYERSQWWQGEHREKITNQKVTPIMIIEGVSSFRREFRPYISYGICMKAPKELRMDRGVKRDLSLGIAEDQAKVEQYWLDWDEEEERYFERDNTENDADLLLDGTVPIEDQVVIDVHQQ